MTKAEYNAMKEGDRFSHQDRWWPRSETYHYKFTGTRREVKGCVFDFFTCEEDGTCCFFRPHEVQEDFIPLP
jgi:hypothetical protein